MIKTIDCRKYLTSIKEEVKADFETITECTGIIPTLAIIQVGDRPDSNKYVKNKIKHIKDCGGDAYVINMESSTTTEDVCRKVRYLNTNSKVQGIVVQEPLPKHIDSLTVTQSIIPMKDIDCLTPENMGLLLKGEPYVKPCTPKGILELLDLEDVELTGKNVLILGRSEIVGKPLQIMLTERNATVTLAHSKSQIKDFYLYDDYIKSTPYDIIISAIGKGHEIKLDMTENHCILIDVGINFTEEGKMIGDIDVENCVNFSSKSWATPVPFGVGTMTCGMVVKNLRDVTLHQTKMAITYGFKLINRK